MSVVAALALATAGLTVLAPSAAAATTSDVSVVPISSGSHNLGGYAVAGFEPTTLSVLDLQVSGHASWSGHVTTGVGWDTGDVRQGANLSVSRIAPLTDGKVSVAWSVTGTISPLGLGEINIGTVNLSKDDVVCTPELSGSDYSCVATSDSVTVIETPGIPLSPYVNLAIRVTFVITPEGAIVSRSFTLGNDPAASAADLSLTGTPSTESLPIPCTAAVGDSVAYGLGPMHWTPLTSATQQPIVQIGLMDPILGVGQLPSIVDIPFGAAVLTAPAFDLTGAGHVTDMGALLPNNVRPTIAPFSTFVGVEGAPVSFGATTTSQCPISSYVWQFSDGTTSYGPSPQRTFTDNSALDGQLTVTDETGLAATRSFSVDVANAAPVANAGPDTTAAWGRLVTFGGSAIDPGSADQPTLSYSWAFGDGTNAGGASPTHAYAAPGDYDAVLTTTDKDGASTTDTRVVHVRKRTVVASYTGDHNGVYDTATALSATLVDEFGRPVPGRAVAFSVAGDDAGSALTSATGVAAKSWTLAAGAPGAGAASATFDGSSDALYESSAASSPYTVAVKATKVSYTGALKSTPNKVISLSALLVDAAGKPLAGKIVVFKLGGQQVSSPPTSAGGIATTTLKLAQKNGTWPLTATYTPAGGDAAKYAGSSTSTTFKIG